MPINALNRSNFSCYVFQPCSRDLSKSDQKIAILATVLLALSLGIGHLVCAIVYVIQSSCKKASKTHEVAQNQLNLNNTKAVEALNSDVDVRNAILDKLSKKFKECKYILETDGFIISKSTIEITPEGREKGLKTFLQPQNDRKIRESLEHYKEFYDVKDFENAEISIIMTTGTGKNFESSLSYLDGKLNDQSGPKKV